MTVPRLLANLCFHIKKPCGQKVVRSGQKVVRSGQQVGDAQ